MVVRHKYLIWSVLILMMISCSSVIIGASDAEDERWFYNSKIIDMELTIKTKVEINDIDAELDFLKVNMSYYPRDSYRQQVLSVVTSPDIEVKKNENIIFQLEELSEKEYEFEVRSDIETTNIFKKVRSKKRFPIDELPDDVVKYIEATEKIDSDNKKIIEKASELAEGEIDLFKVVNKIALWTKQTVEYNLSTQNIEASFAASEVLEKKEGVCDEMTNLFIALLRAVGIPAKFIGGISYTEAQGFSENWGPHGWAEVYFPGTGWVPFDVTYGQLSYIDPTHIKLSEGADSDATSTKYEWRSKRKTQITTFPLDFDVKLKKKEGVVEPKIDISIKVFKENTNVDSYNLIEATVENKEFYYITPTVVLADVEDMIIEGENEKHLVLEPKGKNKVYWIVHFNGEKKNNIIYTIPIIVYSYTGEDAKSSYTATMQTPSFTYKNIQDLLRSEESEEEKIYSKDVKLECVSDKEEMYKYEKVKVSCIVQNRGNFILKNLNICANEDKCVVLDLGIANVKDLAYELDGIGLKEDTITIKAENKDITKNEYVNVKVKDIPEMDILDIGYPESVSYKEKYSINFTLRKISESRPRDIIIQIDKGKYYEKQIKIDELTGDREFILNFQGRELDIGKNNVKIDVKFKDDNNKEYNIAKRFDITLEDVNIFTRIEIVLRNSLNWIGYKAEQLHNKLKK